MRILVVMLILTMGLPVACNTCGGGGPVPNHEMIDQNIEYSEIDIFEETSSIHWNFSIRYEDKIVAMMSRTGSFGLAFACSPPPINYINTITDISITSNKDFYEFAAGEELISLFKRSYYGTSESLVFPIKLESYSGIQLRMIGPVPDIHDHSFTIKSLTSDNKEFVSILNISFQ